jgi:Ni/Fe-hydrogenase subunit HybB-like protein
MRDATHLLFEVNRFTLAFWVEIALLIPPSIVLVYGRPDQPAGAVFRMALVTMAGGCFYRFNVCLGGFMPGQGWYYFPSVMEIVMCAGMVALGIVAYLVMVKTLPIIDNSHPVASH